jgi:hypothetical protein
MVLFVVPDAQAYFFSCEGLVVKVEGDFGDVDAANEFHFALWFYVRKECEFLHRCGYPKLHTSLRRVQPVLSRAVRSTWCKKAAGDRHVRQALKGFIGLCGLTPAAHILYQLKDTETNIGWVVALASVVHY